MKLFTYPFLLIYLNLICYNSNAQATIDCFTTPDGTNGPVASGWSYKEYIVPNGYRIDSVYGGFSRPTYPAFEHDYMFWITQGTTVYDVNIDTQPFDYITINTSLYNIWYNLTSFNYTYPSVVQVYLPTNQFAIWNNMCIAISPSIPMSIELSDYSIDYSSFIPTDQILEAQISDLNGRLMFQSKNGGLNFDELKIKNGIYLLIIRTDNQFITKKLLINN